MKISLLMGWRLDSIDERTIGQRTTRQPGRQKIMWARPGLARAALRFRSAASGGRRRPDAGAQGIGESVRPNSFSKARHGRRPAATRWRSEEHTSEPPSLMRISYAVFCLTQKHTTHGIRRRTKH